MSRCAPRGCSTPKYLSDQQWRGLRVLRAACGPLSAEEFGARGDFHFPRRILAGLQRRGRAKETPTGWVLARPFQPHDGSAAPLVAALRAEVPSGRCIYCERPLGPRQVVRCRDVECKRDYMRDWGAKRRVPTPAVVEAVHAG